MAVLTIPTQTASDTLTTVELEGTDYALRLRKNTRAGAWVLSVLDGETEAPIVCGVMLRPGAPLSHLAGIPGAPPGTFLLFDRGGAGEASLDDLGGRLSLLYQESST